MTNLVSVIVPNYNHARFLPGRLESIINQTYNNLEIIILDDCSSDNSREIISQYAAMDSRIKVHFSIKNSGTPFYQWKKGIELARGELIWIAESDDYADYSLLEKLLESLRNNPLANIAYCQSNFVDSEGNIIGNHIENLSVLNPYQWDKDFCMSGIEVLARYMMILNIIPNASAVVFKKSLCKSIDWERLLRFKLAGDRYFWINILKDTHLCFVADSLNYFRMDGDTVRNKFYNTTTYLGEVSDLMLEICSITKVSLRAKNLAMKQWLQTLRRIKKHSGENSLQFSLSNTSMLFQTLGIYLRK